ncbi:hypothetical protein [Nitrosomonas ureae]|uniref:Uncharacterized protein n=1 Tax=Nitrosomonas ureae TaxID=44577 RepID=A0A2T5I2H8_9PROT|nr:hypothetical protein [Nitrosomonas ureae]PTQ78013.1 hypothetical protein C8R28_10684 [Nitrosomonas ureae]
MVKILAIQIIKWVYKLTILKGYEIMKIIELAQSLGISRQLAYRHIARGMPTENLELAKEWRKRNLDITQTKQWRIDGNKGIKY